MRGAIPPSYINMHRPGIVSVYGNKILPDGTTMEEVEKYHKETLKLAVDIANKKFDENKRRIRLKEEKNRKRKEEHRKNIADISKIINWIRLAYNG